MYGPARADMQFPQSTAFAPYLLLHYEAKDARTVAVTASYMQAGASKKAALATVMLQPDATQIIPLRTEAITGQPDLGSLQLAETFKGNEGDIQLEAGSVDGSGNYVFEAESHIQQWTASRTICYWSTLNDTNTMISLWNYSGKAQNLLITLYHNSGKYELPVRLAAGADTELDVISLIRKRTPDRNGVVLPANVTEGSAILSSVDGGDKPIEIASSTSTFNVRNGTCTNVCGTCDGVKSTFIDPNPIDVATDGTLQANAYLVYNTGAEYNVTNGATWSTDNPSTANVSQAGLVSGGSVGKTNTSFQIVAPVGLGYVCMGNSLNCPNSSFGNSAQTTVYLPQCPTSVYRGAGDVVPPLSSYVPSVLTGIGLDADMRVLPTNSDGEIVSESVTPSLNTCNVNTPNTQSSCTGSSVFQIGSGGGYDSVGTNLPDIPDQFWDQHQTVGNYSILSGSPQQTCTVQCLQQYSCGGKVVGQFTIQRVFTLSNINGYPVTTVSVTKH